MSWFASLPQSCDNISTDNNNLVVTSDSSLSYRRMVGSFGDLLVGSFGRKFDLICFDKTSEESVIKSSYLGVKT